MALRRYNSKKPEQHKVFAKAVVRGETMKDAFLEAGYSELTARKGVNGLTQPLLEALAAEGVNYAKIGAKLDTGHVENAIAGKLYTNMLAGDSKGNEAAKLLGTMKRHNLFQSESTVGVIVIQPSDRSERMLTGLAGELAAPVLPSDE